MIAVVKALQCVNEMHASYGDRSVSPEPSICVTFKEQTPARSRKAALLIIVASIEYACADKKDLWRLNWHEYADLGGVTLMLCFGLETEAERALAVLRAVVAELTPYTRTPKRRRKTKN